MRSLIWEFAGCTSLVVGFVVGWFNWFCPWKRSTNLLPVGINSFLLDSFPEWDCCGGEQTRRKMCLLCKKSRKSSKCTQSSLEPHTNNRLGIVRSKFWWGLQYVLFKRISWQQRTHRRNKNNRLSFIESFLFLQYASLTHTDIVCCFTWP